MLFLLFILMKVCLSEWPPVSCDPQVSVQKNVVTLTSPEQQEREYSCRIQQKFNKEVFINFEKKYSHRIFKKSHDSILGITIMNGDKNLFSLRIHNDRIESDASDRQCYGVFTSKNIWLRIKLHPLLELRKTFISIDTAKNSAYTSCMKFEINDVIDDFSVKIHAITDTGMIQIVHGVTDKPEKTNITHLENELRSIKNRLRIVEDSMKITARKLTENRILVHEKHSEMKRSLHYSHDVHEQKVQTHSIGLLFCFAIIATILIICIKFNGYKHWSREHIL
tara:strand:- start:7680 stop:8519 length:840 start_codon:yes stop_codon:yes gene_type:complete